MTAERRHCGKVPSSQPNDPPVPATLLAYNVDANGEANRDLAHLNALVKPLEVFV